MGANRITLNNDGVALLGNAVLLGGLLKQAKARAQLLDETRTQEVSQDRSDLMTLKNALFAAGQLDERITTATDISKDKLGFGSENTARRLDEIANSQTQLATVGFSDFEFPAAVSARYRITEEWAATDPSELQAPILQLWPSELTGAVRRLVIDYMKDVAAADLGLTRAEAAFVGLDGLVTRRALLEPPKWHLWNSAAARQTRKETGWVEELRAKMNRYVVRPVEQAYGTSSTDHDLVRLGQQLEQIGPSMKTGDLIVFNGLSELANHLCFDPVVSREAIDQLFPSYGAMLEHKNYQADADPFNVFTFMSVQVAWRAVKEGWALCVAEDGLEGRCFSWVPPDAFPSLTETNELALPHEIGVAGCFDLDERVKLTLGAERLWFALTRDVASALEISGASDVDDDKDQPRKREFNKGFTLSDARFVEEGVNMLEAGDAKSALNAAQLLVQKYGEVTENNWEPGRAEIRSYTMGGAEIRLQKKISQERKKRDRLV